MQRRFQTGEKISDYTIRSFIGMGGMGEVYFAVHEKLGRRVAVKVLRGLSADPNAKSRFLNEARVQASLQHPNIAGLYDFQEVGDELFIFMELVEGESLDTLIERSFFSTEESLRTFASLVEAIRFIHQKGIIHRDIKAENVKLSAAGVPKLLDFGIAKDANTENLTRTGGVIGTPNYLTPEQISGGPASVQTDIWSLGVLLYKMLTKRYPFESEAMGKLLMLISQGKFEPVEQVNSLVPKEVTAIVNKCLAIDPAQRYESADELLKDVQAVLSNRYSEKVETAATSGLSLNPAFLVAGAILIAVLTVGLVFGLWVLSGPETTVTKPEPPPVNDSRVFITPKPASTQSTEGPFVTAQRSSPESGRAVRVVQIDAVGGSAEVWRGTQKLGQTPLNLDVQDKDVLTLTLRRPGASETEVRLEITPGKRVYTFSLTPK